MSSGMKKFMISLIVIFVVIAVAAVGVMVYLINYKGSGSMFFTSSTGMELVKEETVPVSGIEGMTVDFVSTNVRIYPIEGNDIVIREYATENYDESSLFQQEVSDGILKIVGDKNTQIISFGFNMSKRVEIFCPEAYTKEFTVKTSSGDVRLEQNITASNISIHTVSGKVSTEHGFTASGNVTVESSSGSVDLGGIEGKAIQVKTVSGRIVLSQAVDGETVTMDTSSGSITVQTIKGDSVSIKTVSGRISVEEGLDAQKVSVKSSSGGLSAGSIYSQEAVVNSVSGRIEVASVTGKIDVESSSGAIGMGSISGSGQIKTVSGRLEAEFAGVDGDINLKSSSGSVTVTVPQDFSYVLKADTSSGRVTVSASDALSGEKHVSGNVGSNPQHSLTVSTTSGNINIQ